MERCRLGARPGCGEAKVDDSEGWIKLEARRLLRHGVLPMMWLGPRVGGASGMDGGWAEL